MEQGATEHAAAETPTTRTPALTASLPPGRYAVSVPGNGGLYVSSLSATDAKVLGHTVEIAGGSPVLEISVASGRTELTGSVRQSEQPNAPSLEGVMVLLVPITLGQPGDTSLPLRAESASDGSFNFHNLQPGRYIAVAIDRGWQLQWTSVQTLAGYLAKGVPLELKAGTKPVQSLVAVLP